jgi:ADP-heptose:LPS heptosyltransferase
LKLIVFKPDAIGDFLIASGAIHLLAGEADGKDLTLVVHAEVEPLARREFPVAQVIGLPFKRRLRGRNTAARNLYHCFPVWLRLCGLRADTIVCLRSRRNFLTTAFFLTPRVRRRIAPENPLLQGGRVRRRAVEAWVSRLFRPVIVPYPDGRPGMPSDLESHRLLASEVLGRRVTDDEVMPRLATAAWHQGGDFWLLCPFSSTPMKDYSVENWSKSLREIMHLVPSGGVRLAGGGNQSQRLEQFADALRTAVPSIPVAVNEPEALSHFPDTVARAGLVLTVDTATAHLACALRAPAVVVACGVSPGIYGPYSPDGFQHWLVGDWERAGPRRWQETIPPSAVVASIHCALAKGNTNVPLLFDY